MEEAGVGEGRRWTAIGCDGLPYILASRIIEDIYIGPVCRCQYDEQREFESHLAETTHSTNADEGRPYGGRHVFKNVFIKSIPLEYVLISYMHIPFSTLNIF